MDITKWRPCQRVRLNAGLCLDCGKVVATKGHRTCVACSKKRQQRRQILYDKRLKYGLCPVCGGRRYTDDLIYCRLCRERAKRIRLKNFKPVNERKYARHRRARFRKQGFCTTCGLERDDLRFKQCGNCRWDARERYKTRRCLTV